jgi:plasmid stability protein
MPVDFSIKQVPDAVAERLRERARKNHRSLQGELRVILEEAAGAHPESLTVREAFERSKALGHVDTGESIVDLIRRMREERTDHLVRLIEAPPKKRPRA